MSDFDKNLAVLRLKGSTPAPEAVPSEGTAATFNLRGRPNATKAKAAKKPAPRGRRAQPMGGLICPTGSWSTYVQKPIDYLAFGKKHGWERASDRLDLDLLIAALLECDGQPTAAGEILQLSRQGVHKKIAKQNRLIAARLKKAKG